MRQDTSFWKHSQLSAATPELLNRLAAHDMASRERVADVTDDWDAARVVADGRAPGLVEFNSVGLVRADEDAIDKLLDKTTKFFQKRSRPPAVYLDAATQPPDLPARLSARGWTRDPGPSQDLMLWDAGARHLYTAPEVYVTMATNATLTRWIEIALSEVPPALHAQWETMWPLEYRANVALWFGLWGGTPAASGSLFVKDGIGQLGRIYVLPEFRGKGVGLALVNFLTRQSRKDGAEETYLFNDHNGPATGLCQEAGYHAIAEDAKQVWTLKDG